MKNHDILIHRDSPLLRGLSNTLIVNTQLGIYHIVKILSKITLATFAIMPVVVKAGLEGAVIFTGQGEIINKNFVRQDSARLGINAAGFSIDINENFTLVQNRATDIALIRVIGQDSSAILGRINAKGQLFIINPNGVLFGKDSHVNVGGLVASSLDISNDNFKRGRYKFINSGRAGAVVNNGELAAEKSGYIALIAPEVRNESEIRAKIGTALLASGDRVTLKIDNGSLVNYSIDKGTLNALVENKQLIQVDGGTVFIGAKAANKVTSAVINNAGIIRARTVENHNGVIKLIGDMQSGTVQVNGTLDASAPDGGNGGFIETSAAHVKVSDNAHVITLASVGKNGSWLIDPVDFTIAVTGGDMTGAAVSSALTGGNLLIYSTSGSSGIRGDVNVNDVVNWSANKLTLNAQHSININANMNGTGTAKLELDYAQFDTAGNINDKYFIANGITVNLPTGIPPLPPLNKPPISNPNEKITEGSCTDGPVNVGDTATAFAASSIFASNENITCELDAVDMLPGKNKSDSENYANCADSERLLQDIKIRVLDGGVRMAENRLIHDRGLDNIDSSKKMSQ